MEIKAKHTKNKFVKKDTIHNVRDMGLDKHFVSTNTNKETSWHQSERLVATNFFACILFHFAETC